MDSLIRTLVSCRLKGDYDLITVPRNAQLK
jgi:hypothetical protein